MTANKGIIITLPRYDDVTEYISYFSSPILSAARRNNINIKELNGEEANKEEFEKVMAKLRYTMIVFNGHGSEDSITGHKNQIIVQCGLNDYLLKEKIVYARSCHAAKTLGRECMKGSTQGCFIGYDLPFMFYSDKRWTSNPRKDAIAPLFLEPSNTVPLSLIKGNTALIAHENGKKHIMKNLNKVLRKGDKESFLFAEAMWNNYIGQVILGNNSATL